MPDIVLGFDKKGLFYTPKGDDDDNSFIVGETWISGRMTRESLEIIESIMVMILKTSPNRIISFKEKFNIGKYEVLPMPRTESLSIPVDNAVLINFEQKIAYFTSDSIALETNFDLFLTALLIYFRTKKEVDELFEKTEAESAMV